MKNDNASDTQLRLIAVQSAYEFARLFLTSLITTQTGALVAIIALGTQHKAKSFFSENFSAAVFMLGASLILGLLTALFSYFNQYFLAFRREKDWLLWTSWVFGLFSIATLLIGLLLSYWSIMERTPR